ncbi:MAG TPA: hypothetical protein VMX14_03600 [Anaerolineae bacterium]|nr:hypothetical protein [Anaerolineae bacterium]HUW13359.1 hypothetical protein [Anaerolineae bacterium]
MTLAEAKAALEALPGVQEVTEFVVHDDLAMPVYAHLDVRCADPYLLPEETRQTIREIHDALERDLGYMVFITMSGSLWMPEWARS